MKADRIGATPKEQLRWALKTVYPAAELTEGDRLNLLGYDLVLFAMGYAGGVPVRSQDYLDETLDMMRQMIDHAIKREEITEIPRPYAPVLSWHKDIGRYKYNPRQDSEFFETRVGGKLGELIVAHGHLLKQCHAPAKMKRGRKAEGAIEEQARGECGNRFLANRDSQIYCSPQCADRALKAGNEPPAKPKMKKKKKR